MSRNEHECTDVEYLEELGLDSMAVKKWVTVYPAVRR